MIVTTQPRPQAQAPLSEHLTVGLTITDKAAVEAAAGAAGLSMSAWGRQVITAALRLRSATNGT